MTETATLPVVSATEGTVNGTTAEAVAAQPANGTNGEVAKTNNETTAVETTETKKKEAEPPKDPKEDPIGWLKQQSSAAVHKVNFHILDWAQKLAIEDESKHHPLPLKGNLEFVTRSQFVSFLKDGQLLAHLANKFAPGSVETVYEGEACKEKTNQVANIEAFINFAKEKAGIPEDQVFTVQDLQEKGKAGYEAVINTLFQLGFKSLEMFNQAGFDLENIVEEIKKVVDPNFLKKLANIFNAGLSALTTKLTRSQSTIEASATENAETTATENGKENGEATEEVKKVEPATQPPTEPVVAQ